MHLHTYIHTYIHAYTHTCIHAYIHAYIRALCAYDVCYVCVCIYMQFVHFVHVYTCAVLKYVRMCVCSMSSVYADNIPFRTVCNAHVYIHMYVCRKTIYLRGGVRFTAYHTEGFVIDKRDTFPQRTNVRGKLLGPDNDMCVYARDVTYVYMHVM